MTSAEGHRMERRRKKDEGRDRRKKKETRPDTRQDIRGRLGRGRTGKTAQNIKIFGTYRPTDRPTQQGVESHVPDEKDKLKERKRGKK